jgi:hypothetical protein
MNSARMSLRTQDQRLARAEFHKKMRKILLKRDAEYFTPSEWKYFPMNPKW